MEKRWPARHETIAGHLRHDEKMGTSFRTPSHESIAFLRVLSFDLRSAVGQRVRHRPLRGVSQRQRLGPLDPVPHATPIGTRDVVEAAAGQRNKARLVCLLYWYDLVWVPPGLYVQFNLSP